MVPALAARVGIRELGDRHWQVICFTRNQFLEHGMGPTVRLLGKASGVSVRELYRLYPRSPSYAAARIAGIPKLYLCHNGGWLRAARAATLQAAAV
jgi:tRNA 2-thiouridine synthesizing protein E